MVGPGSLLKERYRLEHLLGRGGMASVWLATDQVLERPVAVKLLSDTIASDPEFLARFRREARVAAGLSHPNLIGVYDYAEEGERPYLVMEYVPGGNLAERKSSGEAIDCERLARELLGALAHIHAAEILHRDVKPGNVLIDGAGTAKLIDFGIALPRDATSLTRTGNLLGTARYIAPEVMRGDPATERSDLYSCGVVLGDCLGEGDAGPVRALVNRLAEPDQRDRPPSARAALAELRHRGPTVSQPPTAPMATTARTSPIAPPPTTAPPPSTGARRPGSGERGRPRWPGASQRVPRPRPSRRGTAWRKPAAVAAGLAIFAAGFAVFGSESDRNPGGSSERTAASDDGKQRSQDAGERTGSASVPAPSGADPALGAALNEEGFALIQAGRPEEAVPVLEEAVRSFPPGTEDLDYAYALFNLGNALRLSGRPEEAIPVLERRLQIPNQTDVVRRELAAARRSAS